MSIEIEVLNGDASWPQAKPLYDAVWPPHVVATLPWADIIFAHADLRVLVLDDAGQALLPCRHLPPRRHLERAQSPDRRHRRRG